MKRSRHILPLLLLVLCGATALGIYHVRAGAEETAAPERLYRGYIEAMNLVRQKYAEPVEFEAMTTAAISGMLRSLDPHSNYYDRKAFEEMRLEQRSQYYGIGATIMQRMGGVYIMEPFRNTPALRAGLRYGDRIVAINGEDARNWDSDAVRDHLRGELGTKVKVTIERLGEQGPVTVEIQRGAVDLPSISASYLVEPGIGYVALARGFHSTTGDELATAIDNLAEKGGESLVLDLRGNPGGFLDQAIRVAESFLPRGKTILSVRGRGGRATDKNWISEEDQPEPFPVVVLIDDGSASASEIVAGAIQDNDRGLIVGEPSFGKGLVQSIFPLNGGAGLTLTTARYYTPSGRLIQRDYSNGSMYDYLARHNDPGATASEAKSRTSATFRTSLGRVVYGGGGIEPDIVVKPEQVSNVQGGLWSTGIFYFVRELLAGRIAAAPEFKRGPIEIDHQPRSGEFIIDDRVMKAWREFADGFIREHPEIGLTRETVESNLEWTRRKIREEALIAAYGVDMQRRMSAEQDLQLQRAIKEIPQAAQLAERARKQVRK